MSFKHAKRAAFKSVAPVGFSNSAMCKLVDCNSAWLNSIDPSSTPHIHIESINKSPVSSPLMHTPSIFWLSRNRNEIFFGWDIFNITEFPLITFCRSTCSFLRHTEQCGIVWCEHAEWLLRGVCVCVSVSYSDEWHHTQIGNDEKKFEIN